MESEVRLASSRLVAAGIILATKYRGYTRIRAVDVIGSIGRLEWNDGTEQSGRDRKKRRNRLAGINPTAIVVSPTVFRALCVPLLSTNIPLPPP